MNKLLLHFFALMLFFGAISCQKTNENVAEKILEKSIGNNADVELDDEKMVIETDDAKITADATARSWPKAIPSEVPEFPDGDIVMVNTQEMAEGQNWTVLYENVSDAALVKYKNKLTENGFKIEVMSTMAQGGSISATRGKMHIFVLAGEGNASVGISKEP